MSESVIGMYYRLHGAIPKSMCQSPSLSLHSPSAPQNVTVFGEEVIKEVTELK